MKLDRGLLPPKEVNQVLVVLFGKHDLPETSDEVVPLFLQENGNEIVAGMPRFDQWGAISAHRGEITGVMLVVAPAGGEDVVRIPVDAGVNTVRDLMPPSRSGQATLLGDAEGCAKIVGPAAAELTPSKPPGGTGDEGMGRNLAAAAEEAAPEALAGPKTAAARPSSFGGMRRKILSLLVSKRRQFPQYVFSLVLEYLLSFPNWGDSWYFCCRLLLRRRKRETPSMPRSPECQRPRLALKRSGHRRVWSMRRPWGHPWGRPCPRSEALCPVGETPGALLRGQSPLEGVSPLWRSVLAPRRCWPW